MTNRLVGITIDCADPGRLASFWSAMLDIAETDEHGDDSGWATVGSRSDLQPRLTFQRVAANPRPARLASTSTFRSTTSMPGRRHAESLGGKWSGVRHDYDEGVVMVMHDPEGHEFCIVQYYDHRNSESPTT